MENKNFFFDFYFLEIQYKEIKDVKIRLAELKKLYKNIYFQNNTNNLDRRVEEIEYLTELLLINKETVLYNIK